MRGGSNQQGSVYDYNMAQMIAVVASLSKRETGVL